MTFATPPILLLLVGLIPVLAALVWLARWRGAATRRLVHSARGRVSRPRRFVKATLVLTALALIVLAAARPQRGSKRLLLPREGTDVIIALDVSISMLATDVQPNRFEHSKVMLSGLLDRLQGDRVGLVVFAGTAGMRFPLSTDINAARELIRSTAIKEGGLAAGTGIGDAIRVAATSFPPEDETRSKVVLVITDGEDTTGSPQDAVRTARDRGVIVHTIGVGTGGGGAIVIPRPTGTPVQQIDRATGQPATSRRDDEVLRQIASAGRGRYFDGNEPDTAAQAADAIGRLARTRFESQEGTLPIERFQWFAAAALVLLVLDLLLPDTLRRTRGVRRAVGGRSASGGAVGEAGRPQTGGRHVA